MISEKTEKHLLTLVSKGVEVSIDSLCRDVQSPISAAEYHTVRDVCVVSLRTTDIERWDEVLNDAEQILIQADKELEWEMNHPDWLKALRAKIRFQKSIS